MGACAQDKYRMDQHKLYWHLDRVCDWINRKPTAPLHIDLGISSGCNMRCRYCYGVLQGRTGAKNCFNLPKNIIFRLLNDCKKIGVRSIAFIGEGENTLNPYLYDSLVHAKKIGIDVGLGTNGLAIDNNRIKDALESLVWLRFNISAATPKSFFSIHRIAPQQFHQVVNNIRKCVEIKKSFSLETTIGLQMVLLQDNFEDVVPLAKLGKELGVDYLVVKPCSDTFDKKFNSPYEEYLQKKNILQKAENLSSDSFKVYIKWHKLLNKESKDYKTCFGTNFIIAISARGDVFPCGHWFNIRRKEFLMGNILKGSFREIVFSDRYSKVQRKVETVDVIKDCESNCRQHYINEFLWMLKNPPEHINFI